jgi:ATP-dependent DNA helicase PIF1
MLTLQQIEAYNIVKNKNSLFLTGSPGTGKSYTLKKIIEYLIGENIKYGVTALTGAAAILIKGQTLHSFLGIYKGDDTVDNLYNKILKTKKKLNILQNLEVLIIDEISMMDSIMFEKISLYLSKIKNNNKPFGNIQLILIGDFCQLPPINGLYCFQSKLWDKIDMKKILLIKSMRHKDDILFQKILNRIRIGKISLNTYNTLLNLSNTQFDNITPTKLYCLNVDVNRINKNNFNIQYCINNNVNLLDNLLEEHILKNTIECYPNLNFENEITNENNDINAVYNYNYYSNNKKIKKNDYTVSLIKNLQVMITRNINIDNGLVNGTRGYIVKLNPTNVIFCDINNILHRIDYYRDENINDNTFINFMPISLAYALSVHKSQGSTLDAIEIDASSNNFAPGQLYTAMSRAKSLNNIKLINLEKEAFIINTEVKKFYMNL